MKKAILIIDMPESCNTCPIFQQGKGYDRYDLCPVHKSKTIIGGDSRYGGCPLKEIPQMKARSSDWVWSVQDLWNDGWNTCLKEIVGEEKL